MLIKEIIARIKQFVRTLLTERLDPGGAALAVFLGIFIGILPIYGLQTVAALGLAVFFRLNKPLILAATFINNPVLLPPTVLGSIEIGFFLRHGYFQAMTLPPLTKATLTGTYMRDELIWWVIGSVVLGLIVGAVCAFFTALIVILRTPVDARLRERMNFVNQAFAQSPAYDRNFVRWKLKLDRIFSMLRDDDLGTGSVVDLGCGYGMVLAFVACTDNARELYGCDLNSHRINIARHGLSAFNASVQVEDVRRFQFSAAGLILMFDVLQYLPADDQLALLKRCTDALEAGGKLIFRAHDRQRGLWSMLTVGLDWLLFTVERTGTQPLILSAADYRKVLEGAGMQVEMRRFRNRLPLAHILFVATKSAQVAAS